MPVRKIRDVLLPVRCAFCAVPCVPNEPYICEGCLGDLPWHDELIAGPIRPLTTVAAPLAYAFPIDAALKLLKFHRRLDYAPALGELLWRTLRELPADIDAVLPMPLHWRRQAMRGYNQADELARTLRRKALLPMLHNVKRSRSTPFQSGLDAAARKRNLRDAFSASTRVTARHVLIVDDVITTGESCRELAKVLLNAGAAKVSALAVART